MLAQGVVSQEALVAQTPDEYVELAVTLATHTERLSALRQWLRGKLLQSSLTHADTFCGRAGVGLPGRVAAVREHIDRDLIFSHMGHPGMAHS